MPDVLPATKPTVSINMVTDGEVGPCIVDGQWAGYDSGAGVPYYQRYINTHWAQYKDAKLADFAPSLSANMVLGEGPAKGLYVVGPTGTGKTHLLVAVFRELCRRDPQHDIAIVPWLDMVDAIKRDFGKEGDARQEAYYFSHLGVLLIDDFGKGQRTPWVLETMYSIVETRLRLKKLTYFTSNYPLAEVEAWPDGEAIASRIRGLSNELEMLGEDRRR